ncbi:MAG: hypothetical protein ACFFB1_16280 [Promethearchaeota archaeon]
MLKKKRNLYKMMEENNEIIKRLMSEIIKNKFYTFQDTSNQLDIYQPTRYLPRKAEKIFKVNNFIELRLEDGKTIIYVAGEPFMQCKYILINIYKKELKRYGNVESIDDVINIDHGTKEFINPNRIITPEQEFQAHCSNIQAWVEYNYDTRILHSKLSFPLLKKLVNVGDQKAKSIFQKEIMIRFYQGNQTVIDYLIEELYLDYLEIDQIIDVMKISLKKTGSFKADIDLKRMGLKKEKFYYI